MVRLAEQLPLDGAVGRASATKGYNVADYLLTLVAEELAWANWQRANVGRKQTTPAPKPLPRPGLTEKKAPFTREQLQAARERMKSRVAKGGDAACPKPGLKSGSPT